MLVAVAVAVEAAVGVGVGVAVAVGGELFAVAFVAFVVGTAVDCSSGALER